MNEYYNVLLKEQEAQYDLMTAGVIVKATELVNAAQRAVDKDEFTLKHVCDMTDKLDTMLVSISKVKRDIDYTSSKIKELENSNNQPQAILAQEE